ncbi:hypothetical protein KEM48_005800 [Puccinia striiformis f. sp. tritici PST-130]|nr:hypothetical protein KEM48_005861 [Puccinia striiformis f. sp. tritici PST-130]KAI9615000.1 hypothetical protein KEM48_005800 [Puccinia striiformis f. sp. tritici PST-130]
MLTTSSSQNLRFTSFVPPLQPSASAHPVRAGPLYVSNRSLLKNLEADSIPRIALHEVPQS